jgi:phosphatidylcholine synthase
VASAYGFCQVAAKTDDGFFLGFPSYWNLVAFYLYALQPPGWMTVGLLILLSLLTFIPMRYLYPSQPGRMNRVALFLGAVWAALLVLILVAARDEPLDGGRGRQWMSYSLFYPVYYLIASWIVSARYWHAARLKRRDSRLTVEGDQ